MKRSCRKLTALFAAAALCISSVSGCGGAESGSTADVQPQGQTQSEIETAQPQTDAQPQENAQLEEAEALNTMFPLPDSSEEADIYIEPIPGLSDSFIRGMDVSSVLVEERSGVTYYNYDGEEQDIFMTLAQSGINYIRLRVWNDPYDADGNGYGGGNNDVATAIELGKRATEYGMKVCIDFHYSDFWADPKKQFAPKAWEGMSADEKCDALYDYTKESLTQLLDAGVDVGMVQIGNEINNGMAGETLMPSVMKLLSAGSKAVRDVSQQYGKDIQIAVHYTNIEQADNINKTALNLLSYGVDYDIFGMSYYPFWHGTMENMQEVAKNIQDTYGKKVAIMETSYCYTSEDGDGSGNSVSGEGDLVDGYAASVQSQATMIRDICAAANEAGVMGVFYWEGAWIPVGKADADNSPIWEKYGSGWASSYSAEYDPDDAGLYYGGSSWDNQAMFDFEGHPLASLNVFKYLKYGSTAPLAIDYIPDTYITADVGGALTLPEKIDVVYNNRASNEQAAVKWDEAQLAAIDTGTSGSYEIEGTLEDGTKTTCHVKVEMLNHIKNPSFEETDTSMWKVAYEGADNPTDFQKKTDDAHSGDIAFHFWSEASMEFSIEQELTGLEPGTYQLIAYAQGGDVTPDAEMELYAITSEGEQTTPFALSGYANWQEPTIPEIKVIDGILTIGVRIKSNPKSWGTVDDFTLNRISD